MYFFIDADLNETKRQVKHFEIINLTSSFEIECESRCYTVCFSSHTLFVKFICETHSSNVPTMIFTLPIVMQFQSLLARSSTCLFSLSKQYFSARLYIFYRY